MDEEQMNQGILDSFLAPFGEGLVNPNGAVTDMMSGQSYQPQPTAPVQAQPAQPAQPNYPVYDANNLPPGAIPGVTIGAQQVRPSVMEQAAAQPRKGLASWNPFTLLFGDPNNPDRPGLLMK